MCLAVPVCVTECPEEGKARVRVGSGETFMDISTLLLPRTRQAGRLCHRARRVCASRA